MNKIAINIFTTGAANSANAVAVMCDKCIELDRKINRYRQITERVLDPLLTEGVGKLIEQVEAEKAALHPEPQK
jgi:hypothetical protein